VNSVRLLEGVTQGSVLSPVLFIIIVDNIIGIAGQNNGISESLLYMELVQFYVNCMTDPQ
jgi:hypothetical protein